MFMVIFILLICNTEDLKTIVKLKRIVDEFRIFIPGKKGTIVFGENAFIYKKIKINKVWISGKGGKGLIGGVSVSSWPQRENLPVTLAGFFQKVYKLVCVFTQCTDPIGAGKGGNVHENTAAAFHSEHPFLIKI